MTVDPAPRRRMMDKLGFQLAFVLAVVLLPLAVISLSKSLSLVNEVQARSEAALLGETMQAASSELRVIHEARGAAEALAGVIGAVMNDEAVCSGVMAQFARLHPQYSLAAYIPSDGVMRCASTGAPFDFSENPIFKDLISDKLPGFTVNRHGPISGSSVLRITYPVTDPDGQGAGLISLSLPHDELFIPGADEAATAGLSLYTFDRDGEVLTSSVGLDNLGDLPRDHTLATLGGSGPRAFTARSASDIQRVYSVVPLVPGEFYALGTRAAPYSATLGRTLASVPVLLPALMWLASLIAAWLAVERLVTRNVRKLSRSITSFAGGNRVVGDIDLGQAPLEIREMAQAYGVMTATILRDEAELEDTIHQKEVLLREVHHRVKNNLQLIASIMNMQVRRVPSSEARQVLVALRDRVMSLATIHRELFETVGRADIHADELLSSIVRQIAGASTGPGHRFDATTRFDDIRMTPDQAVPLGLLVAEALSNAMTHANVADEEGVNIRIELRRDGKAGAVLDIVNSCEIVSDATPLRAGLGTQLIVAFAQQLGGKAERTRSNGEYRLRVAFDLRPLAEAESRHADQQLA